MPSTRAVWPKATTGSARDTMPRTALRKMQRECIGHSLLGLRERAEHATMQNQARVFRGLRTTTRFAPSPHLLSSRLVLIQRWPLQGLPAPEPKKKARIEPSHVEGTL